MLNEQLASKLGASPLRKYGKCGGQRQQLASLELQGAARLRGPGLAVGDCGGSTWETYQLAGKRGERADRNSDNVILGWGFFCRNVVYQKAAFRNADSVPRKWPSSLQGVSMARPQTRRGEMLTRTQHMYSTPGRPHRGAVTSRSLPKAESATAGARISRGYSVWVTGRWKRTSLHFNAPYCADLWRG